MRKASTFEFDGKRARLWCALVQKLCFLLGHGKSVSCARWTGHLVAHFSPFTRWLGPLTHRSRCNNRFDLISATMTHRMQRRRRHSTPYVYLGAFFPSNMRTTMNTHAQARTHARTRTGEAKPKRVARSGSTRAHCIICIRSHKQQQQH